MDIGEVANTLPDAATAIMTSDMPSLILKIVLAVIFIGITLWGVLWGRKKALDDAAKKTQEEHVDAQTDIVTENQTLSSQAHQAEQEIDDLFGKK